MPTGHEIERRGHPVGFREEIAKAAGTDRDAFFAWFNGGEGAEMAFVRGSWDFSCHIAAPLAPFLEKPEEKSILELGHGGGRILAAAARHFKRAAGVDIHDQNALVLEELERRGIHNVELHRSDGRMLPLPDASFDAAYSFIVMQHVERIDVFQGYLAELYRVLRPGGAAMIYFGRKAPLSLGRASALRFRIDCLTERFRLPRGYLEVPARVNETNLFIARRYAAKLARQAGFEVLGLTASRKKVPDGIDLYGGQHGMALRKH